MRRTLTLELEWSNTLIEPWRHCNKLVTATEVELNKWIIEISTGCPHTGRSGGKPLLVEIVPEEKRAIAKLIIPVSRKVRQLFAEAFRWRFEELTKKLLKGLGLNPEEFKIEITV